MIRGASQQASSRLTRARTRLLLDQPWFGSLAMRLRMEERPAIPTLTVDGSTLGYSPTFVCELPEPELIGCLAHEVMHCAMLHPYRRGSRDRTQWNVACDYAINQALIDAGLRLPAGVLLDEAYRGMSAEQIYAQRRAQQAQQNAEQQNQAQPGGQDPAGGHPEPSGAPGDSPASSPTGDFTDAPAQPEDQGAAAAQPHNLAESDWQIAAEQAARVAAAAGKMPGAVECQIKRARESETDWRAVLREFIAATVPSDYSWTQPSRRHIANGLYLPGTVKENVGALVVAVDTSGSISEELLECFAGELTAILHEARPEVVHVVYCDARVRASQEFYPEDPEVILEAHGRGGTMFGPVFRWVEESGIQPRALLYMTDLDSADEPEEPEYPVLWVTPLWIEQEGPFGATVRISAES